MPDIPPNTPLLGQGTPEPEPEPEPQTLVDQLNQVRLHNQQLMQRIGQMGAVITDGPINRRRLDVFIKFLLARVGNLTPEQRAELEIQFEIEFEQDVSGLLTTAYEEVRKQFLAGGGPPVSPDQIMKLFGGGNGNGMGG